MHQLALLSAIHGFSLVFLGFLPGAFGFPARGDRSFAVFTISSSSSFGTFRSFRMMLLNFVNSGVALNCFGPNGGGSPASACLCFTRHLPLCRSVGCRSGGDQRCGAWQT